ncbi:MAG: IPT/TIG domain-containing protein, partial [bacterium]
MLQKKTKFLLCALAIIIACAGFFVFPKFSEAQNVEVWGEGDIAKTAIEEQTGMRAQDPRVTIVNIIRIVLGFLGIIAVVIIIYAGYLWMTAGGNAEQIETAKMLMRNAVIGLVIILSSFAIVSFILSKLIAATGGGDGLTGQLCKEGESPRMCGCGCGEMSCIETDDEWRWSGCAGGCCGGGDNFFVSSTSPRDQAENVIRNVKIKFYFSRGVDVDSVNNLTFTVKNSDVVVDGTVEIKGNVIEFTPASLCPVNSCAGADAKCFDKDTEIIATAVVPNSIATAEGIISIDGKNLECAAGNPCEIKFRTGTVIDCEPPEIELIAPGQICAETIHKFGASSSDISSLVTNIEFYANEAKQADIINSNGDKPFNVVADSGDFVWDSAGYSQESVNFKAIAYDQDSHSAFDSKTMPIHPAHCCNGIKDEDEKSIDCGGADCAACVGAACGINMELSCGDNNCDDNNCASGFCNCGTYADGTAADDSCQEKGYSASVAEQCCVCEEKPVIFWVKEPNGAPGNLITIGGMNFGATQGNGKVEFIGKEKRWSGGDYEYTFEESNEWNSAWDLINSENRNFAFEGAESNNILMINGGGKIVLKNSLSKYGIWNLNISKHNGKIYFVNDNGDGYKLELTNGNLKFRRIYENNSTTLAVSNDTLDINNGWVSIEIRHEKEGIFTITGSDKNDLEAFITANDAEFIEFSKFFVGVEEENGVCYIDNVKYTSIEIITENSNINSRLAQEVNNECVGAWSDTRIIVQVPPNTVSGEYEVRVTANTGFSDSEKFTVNTAERPGLCLAYKEISGEKKSEGKFEQKINLAGINLNDINQKEEILFGEVSADIHSTITNTDISVLGAAIPNLIGGGISISVQDTAGEKSNPVDFTILESSATPRIAGFEPKAGHSGDYVKIYGQGFGSEQKNSTVKFGNMTGSFSFPAECLASYWSDNQIIVKVPGGLAIDEYEIKVEVILDGNGKIILTHNDKFFVGDYCSYDYKACGSEGACATDSTDCVKSVRPGLCKISPIMGPAKMQVDFYGENFGASIGRAEFNGEKEIDEAGKKVKKLEKTRVIPAEWTKGIGGGADIAKAAVPIVDIVDPEDPNDDVPVTPKSGDIRIISASGLASNGMRFEVGSCEADAQCNISGGSTSFVCCGDNTLYKGACMENQNACGFVLSPPTDYIWSFSTESPTVPNCAVDYTNEAACN